MCVDPFFFYAIGLNLHKKDLDLLKWAWKERKKKVKSNVIFKIVT